MEPLRELIAAFGFLTRAPVLGLIGRAEPPSPAHTVWAYPIVGACVGAAGGGVAWAGLALGLSAFLAASLALAAMVLMTGALHEDGLADTADGLGGGATKARKLEIMRDSRMGTYGTVALILSILIRCAAISALAEPLTILIALVVAGALGRAAMAPMLQWLPSARPDGLGARAARPGLARCGLAIFLAVGAAGALGSLQAAGGVIAVTCIATFIIAILAYRQVGGQTGDILAAGEQSVECSVLVALVAFNSAGVLAF